MARILNLFALLLVLAIPCICQEYYVSPNGEFSDSECPSPGNCHPFNYYVSNASDLFTNGHNISLLFLDGHGVYDLSDSPLLIISDLGYLKIASMNMQFTFGNPQVTVVGVSAFISSVSELFIENIQFTRSLLSINSTVKMTTQFVLFEDCLLSWTLFQRLIVETVRLQNSTFSVSVLSDVNDSAIAEFNNSDFIGNFDISIVIMISSNQHARCDIDNVNLSEFDEIVVSVSAPSSEITMSNSTVLNCLTGMRFSLFLGTNILTITDSLFASSYTCLNITNKVAQTDVIMNNMNFISCIEGLYLVILKGLSDVKVSNCSFTNNNVGFVVVNFGIDQLDVMIVNSVFRENMNGGGVIDTGAYIQPNGNILTLKNVSFVDNVQSLDELSGTLFGTYLVNNVESVIIEDCLFNNNKGFSTLISITNNIIFKGKTTMSNNMGINGGAIVEVDSTLKLTDHTTIRFINNTALEVGGALSFEESEVPDIYGLPRSYPPCTYQLAFNLEQPINPESFDVTVEFYNNTAPTGGDHIYGAALKSQCAVTPDETITSDQIWKHIFKFIDNSSSPVSSTPKRVCLCENGVPSCVVPLSELYYPVSITPGEKFTLNVALVGNDFGITTGSVFALENNPIQSEFLFDLEEELQQIESRECVDLEYSVQLTNTSTRSVSFILSKSSISAASQRGFFSIPRGREIYQISVDQYLFKNSISILLLTAPVVINVTVLECPLGLELVPRGANASARVYLCDCIQSVIHFVQQCSVVNNTGLFYRNGTVWIGRLPTGPEENSSQAIFANDFCPVLYCRKEAVNIDLNQTDKQCIGGRSGILCGSCAENYSLAIGSSQCIPCTNNDGIAYIVLFMLAGVILVATIKLLDLTVARATINGLIFYANVLWINQSIFFSLQFNPKELPDVQLYNYYSILRVFIAWINLDFGIVRCFYIGLDSYVKTWLQFVFPLYILSLSLFIAFIATRSTKATRWLGNNTVHVLPTLFALSWAKLLRNVVSILSSARLHNLSTNTFFVVWTVDGNILYFTSKHAPLFLVALFVGIFSVCFCSVLIFAGHIRKVKHKKLNQCIVYFYPLLEAFTGPLNSQHQYWPGLTFLFRNIFVVVAAIFKARNPNAIIAVDTVLTLILVAIVSRVYRKLYVSLLELCFLLNLAIVSVAFLSDSDTRNRVIFMCVSVSITFVLFLIIVVGHLCAIVAPKLRMKLNLDKKENEKTATAMEMNAAKSASLESEFVDLDFVTQDVLQFRDDIIIEENTA